MTATATANIYLPQLYSYVSEITYLKGSICKTTEKAICFQLDSGVTVWFPKAAIKADGQHWQVAKWFKFQPATFKRIVDSIYNVA